MDARDVVTYASLLAGALCFLLYLAFSAVALFASHAAAPAKSFHADAKALIKAQGVSVGEFTDLLKALAQVSDSLSKAAPSLVGLIGAILFFTIAAVSSGALHGAPPAPASAAKAPATDGKGDAPAPPASDAKSPG